MQQKKIIYDFMDVKNYVFFSSSLYGLLYQTWQAYNKKLFRDWVKNQGSWIRFHLLHMCNKPFLWNGTSQFQFRKNIFFLFLGIFYGHNGHIDANLELQTFLKEFFFSRADWVIGTWSEKVALITLCQLDFILRRQKSVISCCNWTITPKPCGKFCGFIINSL